MHPELSESHHAIRREYIGFAREQLDQDVADLDAREAFNREGWGRSAAAGVLALPFPERYGGRGLDVVSTVAALEALGSVCLDNGLMLALNAQMWACTMPILTFGNEAQHQRFLPGLISGETIACHAASEAEAGSDIFAVKMRAERQGDHYVLSGSKTFVTNAPVADLAVVLANVDPEGSKAGLTTFIVDTKSPGFEDVEKISKMGLRSAQMGGFTLRDCKVSETNRLGEEGTGMAVFSHALAWERSCLLASAVGAMERLLAQGVRYARRRCQFAQPIGGFQAVSHPLAEAKLALETSRALLYRCARQLDLGRNVGEEAALAKLHISESWVKVATIVMRVHGGRGYTTEPGIERELRDAIGSQILSGTSDIQREIIAGYMGL